MFTPWHCTFLLPLFFSFGSSLSLTVYSPCPPPPSFVAALPPCLLRLRHRSLLPQDLHQLLDYIPLAAHAVLHRELFHIHSSLQLILTILRGPWDTLTPALADTITCPRLTAYLRGLDASIDQIKRATCTTLVYTDQLFEALGLLHLTHFDRGHTRLTAQFRDQTTSLDTSVSPPSPSSFLLRLILSPPSPLPVPSTPTSTTTTGPQFLVPSPSLAPGPPLTLSFHPHRPHTSPALSFPPHAWQHPSPGIHSPTLTNRKQQAHPPPTPTPPDLAPDNHEPLALSAPP